MNAAVISRILAFWIHSVLGVAILTCCTSCVGHDSSVMHASALTKEGVSLSGGCVDLLPKGSGTNMIVASHVKQPPARLRNEEWKEILELIGRIPHVDHKVVRVVGWGGNNGEIIALTVWTELLEIYLIRIPLKSGWKIDVVSGYVAF